MKLMWNLALLGAGGAVALGLGSYLAGHPTAAGWFRDVFPYFMMLAIIARYETRIENLSMDLWAVENRLEEMSVGEWQIAVRFRGDPSK